MICKKCGSQAINPGMHGRDETSDLDLCDVCFWRVRAEKYESMYAECDSDLDCMFRESERLERELTEAENARDSYRDAMEQTERERDEWKAVIDRARKPRQNEDWCEPVIDESYTGQIAQLRKRAADWEARARDIDAAATGFDRCPAWGDPECDIVEVGGDDGRCRRCRLELPTDGGEG